MKTRYKIFIAIILLIIGAISVYKEIPKAISISGNEYKLKQSCNESNAVLESNCLRNELNSWWKYNITNLYKFWDNKTGAKDVNFSFIKENGGVCWQASEWYKLNARNNNFYSDTYYLDIPPANHSIAIISDDYGNYCILDQNAYPLCNKVIGEKNES